MNKIRAIITDDEESARDVLENLLHRFCPEVEVVAKCRHVKEAVEVIQKEKPELVFLDIEMPQYAGYEIVNYFQKVDFGIIFVTAYDQYAVRAFELAAIDYLLKPVDIARLKKAVKRAIQYQNLEQQSQKLSLLGDNLASRQINNIVITDKGQQHVIPIEQIIAIEAQESYCTLYTTGKMLMASKNLKHFENMLESLPVFFRVHKSWIINKKHLQHYSRSDMNIHMSQGIIAKLSKYKKVEFESGLAH